MYISTGDGFFEKGTAGHGVRGIEWLESGIDVGGWGERAEGKIVMEVKGGKEVAPVWCGHRCAPVAPRGCRCGVAGE